MKPKRSSFCLPARLLFVFCSLTTAGFHSLGQEFDKTLAHQKGTNMISLSTTNLSSLRENNLANVHYYANYDYPINALFSIGCYVGYAQAETKEPFAQNNRVINGYIISKSESEPQGDYTFKFNTYFYGASLLHHWNISDKWDFYSKVSAGFRADRSKTIEDSIIIGATPPSIIYSDRDLTASAYIGTRRFFTNNVGAHAEIGGGFAGDFVSPLNQFLRVGVNYRFLRPRPKEQ